MLLYAQPVSTSVWCIQWWEKYFFCDFKSFKNMLHMKFWVHLCFQIDKFHVMQVKKKGESKQKDQFLQILYTNTDKLEDVRSLKKLQRQRNWFPQWSIGKLCCFRKCLWASNQDNRSGLSPSDVLIIQKLLDVIQRSLFGRHSNRRVTKKWQQTQNYSMLLTTDL